MADVVISYTRENEATARLVAETLAKEGYDVWRDDSPTASAVSADVIAGEIGRARAVVVIWSEAASASEWVRAEANVARGMKKLVQATADDQPPPIPFDSAQVASLSTWLGDPGDADWQRVRNGVQALCGPPDSEKTVVAAAPAAAVASPPPAVAAAPAPAPEPIAPASASAPTATPVRGSKGGLVAALIVLFALLAGGGYWAWQQGWLDGSVGGASSESLTATLPPGPGTPSAATPAPQAGGMEPPAMSAPTENSASPAAPAADAQFTQQAVVRAADGFALVRSAPDGAGLTVARINEGEAFTTYPQQGDWWRVRTASGAVGYMLAASIQPSAEAAAQAQAVQHAGAAPARRRPTGPRINRANSENMRLFCQNAGQGTPQCRRFRQQLRDQRR
ncbi:TIR domain-containing protein [Sphingosinicella sp. LHD-64]|uniref:TIR domain-containing protein n=1 Tax=Sphingosinicella sp. LHD-64 TaxID=3072139 RepID=UPI00280EE456|nr:TIR domain-containing protein [Sphingosinicella sp. LHD-64]MDQ8754797.1 TIR domain-containing protein [Sphingosinicella sp. LHD-64]